MLPPIPSWEGFHPLVVHFPIALLLVAPLFLIASLVLPKFSRTIAFMAWTLMVLGLVGILVSMSTGEAAEESGEEIAEQNAAAEEVVEEVMEEHEELAESTRTMFIVLTLIYGAILVASRYVPQLGERGPSLAVNGVFLVLYMVGAGMLANTAHLGGRLVHEYGVHAQMQPSSGASGHGEGRNRGEGPRHREEHEDDDD